MKNIMKSALIVLFLMLGVSAMAQQRIQLQSSDNSKCEKSDMTSLRARFSFSVLEAQDCKSSEGDFSVLSLPNTVIGGNVGDPQIPVVSELIAVPVGCTPRIEVKNFHATDYSLDDYGIKTLMPRQPSPRKDKKAEDIPFVYNKEAYEKGELHTNPDAVVKVVGTMRGVRLAQITIEPLSYDPVKNIVRVFNDIDVEVSFDGAMSKATEDLLLKTYSPHFNVVYDQLFNGSAVKDAYSDHPDLYNTPIRMLVICYSGFQGNSALNQWLQWKRKKGYDVDIFYTNETGTTESAIASFIKTKYNASVTAGNAYTYLIVIGDTGQVPPYMMKYIDSDIGYCASDLGYASVNFSSSTSNYFPDMFYSRISVENTTHLTNYINKVLAYERYEFEDGGDYLNNVLLVGGWDSNWTARVAKPTINYATNYYFNSSNTTYGGFNGGTIHATISTGSSAGYSGTNHGVYNGINDGACFVNYTAHGDKQEWQVPQFTAAQVASLSNTGKYFFGVGNCCLTGNFNNTTTSYSPGSSIGANACFAETMIRVPNAGAVAYIGCSPYSYWYEDFYWAVGAHSVSLGNYPTQSASSKGVYDVMFEDQNWNSASALLYVGNLAVQQAVTNNYSNSQISGSGDGGDCNNSAHYYFQFYHTFGDGSVMPYVTKPETNTVTLPGTINIGTTSITVNAVAGSYVAVTDNNSTLCGVAEANSSGVATVNFTYAISNPCTLNVVVTRQQYQPYFGTIEVIGTGEQYTITANVNNTDWGTVEGAGTYYENAWCTLTATANHGYAFDKWNDGNTENPRTITVTGDAEYTAIFRQLEEHHIIYTAQQTNGTISVSPENAFVGDEVTLTAYPATGYALDQWTVTTVSKEAIPVVDNKFIMPDSEVSVSATFKLEPVDLTVNDGTATNQYIPMYGYYFDDYTKSECIIPASELTGMVGGTITSITFYPSSVATINNTWGEAVQTVFLKEVSGTTLGGSYSGTSGGTTVKVGSPLDMPIAGEAYTITFDTPYTYGGGNLLIGIYNDDGSYNKVEWYGTNNLSSGVSAYGYNGSSLSSVPYTAQSFLPKTTFTFTISTSAFFSLTPSTATLFTGFTETLTATAFNVSGTPTITFTSSNNNVATVSGNGTTATVTAVAPGTATITATMNYEGETYTATCAITVEDPILCEPSFNNPNDDYISNFATSGGTNNIDNTSTYATSGYSDYYNDYAASIMAGETLGFTVTSSSTQWSYGHAIWVDWNNDYQFSSDEKVAYTTSTATGNWSGSFIVPDNTPAGNYHLRVIHLYNNSPTDACMSGSYGEAEDYKLTVLSTDASSYDITATVNPANAGTITGEGTYNHGAVATLTATANPGYIFSNWTKNGTEVSTNATYSFTVTEAATLVANFTPMSYTVTATSDPIEGGTVAFGSKSNRDELVYDFEDGWQGWTTFQGNTTSPNSWMHNTAYPINNNDFSTGYGYNSSDGFMLSESYISGSSSGSGTAVTPDNYLVSPQVRLGGSISFYAGARNTSYCAEKFSVMVSTTDNTNPASFTTVETWTLSLSEPGYNPTPYTVDLSAYSGMGYIAIRHFDCYDQWFLSVDNITIVEGSDGSTASGTFNYGESCTLVATPNTDYHFVNWTENGTEVSTNPEYSFSVTDDRDLVANFGITLPLIELANDDSEMDADHKNSAIIAANNGETVDVKLAGHTLFKDGDWNTICLPFSLTDSDANADNIATGGADGLTFSGTPLKGAIVKTLEANKDTGISGHTVRLGFSATPVTTLVAGEPYIIKWTKAEGYDEADPDTRDIVDPVFNGVTINETVNPIEMYDADGTTLIVKFVGYYDALKLYPTPIDGDAGDFPNVYEYIYYMTAGGTLKHTAENKPRILKTCRAYFDFSSIKELIEQNAAREFILDFGNDETTTSIGSVKLNVDNETDNWYTVDGRKVHVGAGVKGDLQSPVPTHLRKGLYIHNGKKVVIK